MKRISIFCDGTWNRLSAKYPTNVVLAAQLVKPVGDDGIRQITYYNQGVGTSYLINENIERVLAGAFGWGLFDKIADAYRFLVFNYEPGDEVYIFGFSRGAFTARSLGGLIRKCGIVTRDRLEMVDEAFAFYKDNREEAHPDGVLAQQFRMENSQDMLMKEEDRTFRRDKGIPDELNSQPLFTLTYLGVWDTVGALGVPQYLLFEHIFHTAAKYQFHDLNLSSVVKAARHGVAIDEDRLAFAPALWENLPDLTALPGRSDSYKQLWFPGDHGSVGGGGDIRGLSNGALLWILEGAQAQGLSFDENGLDRLGKLRDPLAPLVNSSKPPGWTNQLYRRGSRTGPVEVDELAASTLERIAFKGGAANWVAYKPKPLEGVLGKMGGATSGAPRSR